MLHPTCSSSLCIFCGLESAESISLPFGLDNAAVNEAADPSSRAREAVGFSAELFWQWAQGQVQSFESGKLEALCTIAEGEDWTLSRAAKQNPKLYCGMLMLAHSFHFLGCVGVRVGNGVKVLPGYHPQAHSLAIYGHMSGPDSIAHTYDSTTYSQMTRLLKRE